MSAWAPRLRAVALGAGRVWRSLRVRHMGLLAGVGAMAAALLVLGALGITAWNLSRGGAWGEGVQLVVYLQPDVPVERARAIAAALRGLPAAERVEYVPPDVAQGRLAASLGPDRDLLEGVEAGFLPASIEVTLAAGLGDVAAASPVVRKLRTTPGVEDVELVGAWADKISALRRALWAVVITLGLLVAAGAAYVVGGALSLAIHRRKDELDVLRLVGATRRFVRLPMLAEGAVHGLLGVAASLALLFVVFRLTAPRLEALFAGAGTAIQLEFLPPPVVGLALAGGIALGLVGSWLAILRADHAV